MDTDSKVLCAFFATVVVLIICITWGVDRQRQVDYSANVQQLSARVDSLERILAKAATK